MKTGCRKGVEAGGGPETVGGEGGVIEACQDVWVRSAAASV